jgi:Sugar (and other) transporter
MTICAARYDITQNPAAGNAVIGMLVLYGLSYSIAWSGLLVAYAVEIVPFALRAKGLAIMFFCVNAALFFNNYVNPIALAAIRWKYYIVYVAWLLVELIVVYVFYPETRGPTLEEMAKIFDGDEAAVGRVDLDIVREKHGIEIEERENAGPQNV